MHTVLLVARVLLAAVFVVAGLAKLADLAGSRAAVAGFGVPERLARPLGTLLPFAELAVAVTLLPASTGRYGAIGAAVLLGMFVIAIARSMIRGEAPDCHCFGQLHSEPAGWRTLVRNAGLGALAVFVIAAGPGTSATAWIGRLSDAGAVALGAGLGLVAVATLACFGFLTLLRQNGRLLLRIDELEQRLDSVGAPRPVEDGPGLPIGSPAPSFTLSGLYGETVTLEALVSAETPVLLLFTDPNCGPCNALLPQIAAWQRDHGGRLTIAVLTRGSNDDNRAKVREHGVAGVWLDADLTVYNAYEAIGTPGAVVIDSQGRIASNVVGGADAIAGLVQQALGGPVVPVVQVAAQPAPPPLPPSLPIGADAPTLELSDLDGEQLSLVDSDRDTLVLFWNPGCGFCQRMLDDLKAWEREPPPDAPRLLLISTGSVEDNRAMGLDAPIALDQQFAAGAAFGTTGTPSGIVVDTGGKVASTLGVGAPAVMELAVPAK